MESGRLLAIIYDLTNEGNTIDAGLKNLVEFLAQPSNTANLAESIEQKKAELYILFDNSFTNRYSIGSEKILNKIGGGTFFGANAKKQLDTILQNGYNIPEIINALNTYIAERAKFIANATKAQRALESLNIQRIDPTNDHFDIGVMVPEGNQSTLEHFENHFHEWNKVYKTLGELTVKDTSSPKIKYFDNNSLDFYVEHPLETAATIVFILKNLSTLYLTIQRIRTNRSALEEDGYDKRELKEIEKFEKKTLEDGIKNISDSLIKENKILPERKNELKTALNMSIKVIAKSIDKGVEVDIVFPIPQEQEQTADTASEGQEVSAETEKKSTAIKARKEKIEMIEKGASALKHLVSASDGIVKLLGNGEDEDTDDAA